MTSQIAVAGSTRSHAPIRVDEWPSETPLYVVSILVSLLLWALLAISIIGLFYIVFFGVFFAIAHLLFVTHVRGNGVRLGPDQFPELHERVQELARRMEMEKIPDAYLMQAGGALNAFATRFLRRHMIVLFSDLLEACDGNDAARDMIIGHELGHIRAGHLSWRWLIMPASIIPFLGTALSRAREFTCDRYGYASAGDHNGALLGLTILAAGGKHAPSVNREALVRQRQDLNTGLMTIGTWFSTHPPLARRIFALDPSLGAGHPVSNAGTWRAFGIIGLILSPFILAGWLATTVLGDWFEEFRATLDSAATGAVPTAPAGEFSEAPLPPLPANAQELLADAVREVSTFLNAEVAAGRALPIDLDALRASWAERFPDTDLPRDPYDGDLLGYARTDTGYSLISSGPDRAYGTSDDLEFTFPNQ